MEATMCKQCKQSTTGLQYGRCINCRTKSWSQNSSGNTYQHLDKPSNNSVKNHGPYPVKPDVNKVHKPDPNAICKHFIEGTCKHGNNCKYTHAVVIGPNSQYNSPINEKPPHPQQKNVYKPQNPKKGNNISHNKGQKPQRPKCKYFQKGYCKNGFNCNFRH